MSASNLMSANPRIASGKKLMHVPWRKTKEFKINEWQCKPTHRPKVVIIAFRLLSLLRTQIKVRGDFLVVFAVVEVIGGIVIAGIVIIAV